MPNDYRQQARKLVESLRQRMGPSPYDIAWLARLPNENSGHAHWPDLVDWLVEHQHPDGSWGSEIVYYHDRIICTLTAAIALVEHGHSAQAQKAVQRAERYLWLHLHFLPRDPADLVGFELIFPSLLETARGLGLEVPYHTFGYGRIQSEKLRLIPPDMLYSPHVSLVHSLEFLGRSGRADNLRKAKAPNGSVGNSPATTAYYLLLAGDDPSAWNYLEAVRRNSGLVNIVYPFQTFNLTWVLNNLAYSGLPVRDLASSEVWEGLAKEIDPDGVSFDPSFGVPDGDTTSVCARLLLAAGYPVDPCILQAFEDKNHTIFRTYRFERNPSVGTNVHALEALHHMPEYPNRRVMQEAIILMLLDQRRFDVYWTDKWHASPYYATTHALVGLLQGDFYLDYFCRPTVDWLLHTQRPDGSWGFYEQSTAEETAYAMTALLHYNRNRRVPADVLHRGAAYLAQAVEAGDKAHPPMWIEKCLYVPYEIVQAAILAALIQYDEAFGRAP
jgi:halimadienyl-diphosphate synthase